MKKYSLLNASGNVIEQFETQVEMMEYCLEHKIANSGWIKRSLKTGEPFYWDSNPYKDYNGYNFKAIKCF